MNDFGLDEWHLCRADRAYDAKARLMRSRERKDRPFTFERHHDEIRHAVVWVIRIDRWAINFVLEDEKNAMMGIDDARHYAAVNLMHVRRLLREHVEKERAAKPAPKMFSGILR